LRGHAGSLAAAIALLVVAAAWSMGAAPAPPQTTASDLFVRVGLTTQEAAAARSGQPSVRVLPNHVDTEVRVAGAIRIRGDVERLTAWLRDVEQFRRSLGADVVGAIENPARVENFSSMTEADAKHLHSVAAGYQRGDTKGADQFKDMLRRAATLWKLAYPFALYLEEYPASRPAGVDDRFYWTRETTTRHAVLTLHHVALERLPDTSLRFADKQFYASRDIDAALLVGQATPAGDGHFDLVVAMYARLPKLGSTAARVLRNRVSREVADSFSMYLDWLKQSFALG
jgi:hypothetical protein